MANVFAQATFASTDWQILTATSPVKGGPWVTHPTAGGNFYVVANRALCRSAGLNYISGTPGSADYSVSADVVIFSSIGDTGVAGRISTSSSNFYYAYLKAGNNEAVLAKMVGGLPANLGSWFQTFNAGTTYVLTLDMVGTTIRLLIDGVQRVSVTDSTFASAGRAGIRCPTISDVGTGKHLDNFIATDTSTAPSPRSYVVGMVGL